MIISSVLVAVAAIANAVMDRTEEPVHFNKSIFRNKDQRFWLKSESWKYAKMVFKYRFDAWHISKSVMVVCALSAIVVAMYFPNPWLPYGLDILVLGAIWNLVFNTFYNHIFKAKK